MPARTNPFQELIFSIEQSLAGSGWKVRQSYLIYESVTDESREIDIFIEREFNGKKIGIAIECRDYNHPQSVTFIEQLHGKYILMKDEIQKVIAVSSSGFYEPALKKAVALGIETRTFAEAIGIDWKGETARMLSTVGKTQVLGGSLSIILSDGSILSDSPEVPRLPVIDGSGRLIGSLLLVLDKPLKKIMKDYNYKYSRKLGEDLLKMGKKEGDFIQPISLGLELRNLFIIDSAGTPRKISKVILEYELNFQLNSADADIFDYDSKPVALSSIILDSERIEVTLVRKDDQFIIAKSSVQPSSKEPTLWSKKKKRVKINSLKDLKKVATSI